MFEQSEASGHGGESPIAGLLGALGRLRAMALHRVDSDQTLTEFVDEHVEPLQRRAVIRLGTRVNSESLAALKRSFFELRAAAEEADDPDMSDACRVRGRVPSSEYVRLRLLATLNLMKRADDLKEDLQFVVERTSLLGSGGQAQPASPTAETTDRAAQDCSASSVDSGERHTEGGSAFEHFDNYRTVRMDGERFELTPTQAGIVRALHKAYEGGNPERPQEYVLEEAGSSASRMSGLFKRNRAAWKALILPGTTKGSYRLNL